ncbi:MAG: ankyrin repeat domain-containing protein [Armatimonadota bacterium]
MTEHVACRGFFRGLPLRHFALALLLLLSTFAGAADLFEAAQQGDVAVLKRLLAKSSVQVDARNADGNTPLLLAVRERQSAAVALLLDAGASLKAQDTDGLTPLHLAARGGDAEMAVLLLNRKADILARDHQGWTPLQWAIASDHLDTAKALLARGAAVNVADGSGATPLHWAAANGQISTLEVLLGKGAAINVTDDDGDTALHWAAAAGQDETARFLLARGANPSLKDRQGRTALQVADEQAQPAVVSLLQPKSATPAAADLQIVAPDETPSLPTGAALPSRRFTKNAITHPAANPLGVRATALTFAGGRLFIGLDSGSLYIYDIATRKAIAVGPPSPVRTVRAIATGSEGVWWLTARPSALCYFHPESGTVTAYAFDILRPDRPLDGGDTPQLTCWRGRVVVCTREGARALDPKTGEVHPLTALLPEKLAAAAKGARLFLAADGDNTLLAAVRPNGKAWTATCWRSGGTNWASAGPQGVGEWCGITACSPERLALLGNTRVSDLAASAQAVRALGYRNAGAKFSAPRWAAANATTVWWSAGDVLFHAASGRGEVYAYLPWNEPGVSVRCAAADETGVWLATNRGVRRLDPGNPSPTDGFAGFVRMRLGAEAEQPITESDRKLAAAIEEWQGTPYRWGGASRSGTDCSGFVMAMHQVCGVNIPHGSANLRVTPIGRVVRDELRYGDVLVFPGHAALYIGNGRTAETVANAGVGKSTLWSRRSVVVRRFLNLPHTEYQLASRKGDRNTAAKRKAATKKK